LPNVTSRLDANNSIGSTHRTGRATEVVDESATRSDPWYPRIGKNILSSILDSSPFLWHYAVNWYRGTEGSVFVKRVVRCKAYLAHLYCTREICVSNVSTWHHLWPVYVEAMLNQSLDDVGITAETNVPHWHINRQTTRRRGPEEHDVFVRRSVYPVL
jgi:hypothetical protein